MTIAALVLIGLALLAFAGYLVLDRRPGPTPAASRRPAKQTVVGAPSAEPLATADPKGGQSRTDTGAVDPTPAAPGDGGPAPVTSAEPGGEVEPGGKKEAAQVVRRRRARRRAAGQASKGAPRGRRPAAKVGIGRIAVNTKGGRAKVYIDGKYRGETPLVKKVRPGRHRVKVVRGSITREKPVRVPHGRTVSVSFP
jgi:hypothetical protein